MALAMVTGAVRRNIERPGMTRVRKRPTLRGTGPRQVPFRHLEGATARFLTKAAGGAGVWNGVWRRERWERECQRPIRLRAGTGASQLARFVRQDWEQSAAQVQTVNSLQPPLRPHTISPRSRLAGSVARTTCRACTGPSKSMIVSFRRESRGLGY